MQITKLSKSHYENIRHLFRSDDTNLPQAYGTIEGLIPGEIWVDDENNPEVCLILGNDKYCLMAGKINEKIFQSFFEVLKLKHPVFLWLQPDSQNNSPLDLSKFEFTILPRKEYRYRNLNNIPKIENTSPYLIKPIDKESLFNLCIWKVPMLEMFGNVNNYLRDTMSFALINPEKNIIVSEAHGFCSKNLIELVAVTHEDYRGQGLSTIICNYLIHRAIENNLKPVWSCNASNISSFKVAEKQGFDSIIDYIFYVRK